MPADNTPSVPADDRLARKLAAFMPLTAKEREFVRKLLARRQELPAQSDLIVEGEPLERVYALTEGWACRYKLLSDGRRQILNFVLPGDFVGLRANWSHVAEHSVTTLTDVELCSFRPDRLIGLYRRMPRLGAAIAWSSAREEAMLAEQVVRIGRRTAYERLAHLLIELLERLRLIGLAGRRSYELPLTQEVLADTLGLSIVHVNRTLRRLREDGLIDLDAGKVVIADLDRLRDVADFEGGYLAQGKVPPRTERALSRIEQGG